MAAMSRGGQEGLVKAGVIETANGHDFNYDIVDASRIDIETVAHSLSNICRFTGHCRSFYSVAQHCVLMSWWAVPEQDALYALMHESGEPLCGDMNKPLKLLLPQYDRMEGRVQRQVLLRFGLDPDAVPASIKPADYVMLATEQRDLMPTRRAVGWDERGLANRWEAKRPRRWADEAGVVPLTRRIQPWTPEQAKEAFLQRYLELRFEPKVRQAGTVPGWTEALSLRSAA